MSYRKLWILLDLLVSVYTQSHANSLMNQHEILQRVSRNTGNCFTKVDSYGGEDFLCIVAPPKHPGRIALTNRTSGSSLVVDPYTQQYAFLQKNGAGLVVDEDLQLVYDIKRDGPWSTTIEAVPSLNFSDITKNEVPKELNAFMETTSGYEVIGEVVKDLDYEDVSDHPPENFFSMIRRKIQELMNFLSTVLMNILTFVRVTTWSILRFGLTAFFNVVKWIARFIAGVAGGIGGLIQKGIRFSLGLISMARNGIEVLAILLKSLAEKFDLAAILKSILDFPLRVFNMVVGLGGQIFKGISSVYSIISHLVQLIKYCLSHPLEAITKLVRSVMNQILEKILKYFTKQPVQVEDYSTGCREIEEIIEQQNQIYGNGPRLRSLLDLLNPSAVGNGTKIFGVDIAPIFQELSGVTNKSMIDSSVGMFSQMKPVMPLNKSMKNLIIETMHMMNSPQNLENLAVVEPDLAMHVTIKVQMRSMHVEILDNTTLTEVTDGHPLVKKLIDRYITAVEVRNGEKAKQEVVASLDSDLQFKQDLLKYAAMIP